MNANVMDRGVIATQATNTHGPGVSWAAILAGAAAGAALALSLLVLGVGLGLSTVSPWAQEGMSATGFGVATIIWLTVTQILVSGLGGYVAGRLRNRWVGTQADEVFFRDTAHGFLAWSVGTLFTAAVLTSAVTSVLGTGVQAGASVAGGAGTAAVAAAGGAAASGAKGSSASDAGGSPNLSYFVDSMFRKGPDATASGGAPPATDPSASTGEISTIVVQSLKSGTMSPDDVHYAGQLVAQRTGLSQADAEKRVTDVFGRTKAAIDDASTKAREAADKARKASSYVSLWLFVALLIGAFSASYGATIGGRQRDR